MSKQTAVEWFESEAKKLKIPVDGVTQDSMIRILEQAKQMEKEQIMDAWSNGFDEDDRATSNPFKYYNETYTNEK